MAEITDEEFQSFQWCLVQCKYRVPLEITEIAVHYDRSSFPVCPRCKISIDREYQSYCDRCGQKLAWNLYYNDKVTIRCFP